MSDTRLPVVLFWHMHQPPYRDALSGRYVLPWTWLHAIKDYTDMAAHLEQVEGVRAVVNFTPVLVEQIEDLARAVQANLETGEPLPDSLLATLSRTPLPQRADERLDVRAAGEDLELHEEAPIGPLLVGALLADVDLHLVARAHPTLRGCASRDAGPASGRRSGRAADGRAAPTAAPRRGPCAPASVR